MLNRLRKFLLPNRKIVLRFNSNMNVERFTSEVNINPKSIFSVQDGTLRFSTWSFQGKKLDKCAFLHTSIRAKVRAKLIADNQEENVVKLNISSRGRMFVYFFLLGWIVISIGGIVTLLKSKGILLSLGFVVLFSLIMILYIRLARAMFEDRGIRCFIYRLKKEMSENGLEAVHYIAE